MKENNEIKILQSKYNELLTLYNNKSHEELLTKSLDFCKKYPKNQLGFNILALAYKNNGKIDKARDLYENLINAGITETSIYTNAGNFFGSLGNVKKAINCHEKAISIDPECIGSLNGMGLCLFNEGKTDEAISYYSKVLEIDPSQTHINTNIANCMRLKQSFSEAADFYGRHNSKISQAQKIECLYKIRNIKEFDKAMEQFIKDFGYTPLVGTLSTHSSIVFSRENKFPFCNNPFDFIQKSNIFEGTNSNDIINNFVSDFNKLKITKKDQSLLQNGFQSSGNIFLQEIPSIQLIKNIITEKIEEYRETFSSSNSGIIKDWPKDYSLYGWLIMIRDCGFLSSHIHKEGWLSGSLYINIPEKLEGDAGNLKFSLDGNSYPNDNKVFPEKIVDLGTGDIILFPSSIFHSTVPFTSKKNRITLAFDVRPSDLETVIDPNE
tara:strand:+ start:18236 stop:19546 length:1311 start_codon:yes stop_codon:yes gene_type:complete